MIKESENMSIKRIPYGDDGKKVICWECGDEETDIMKIPSNNLWIEDDEGNRIWDMSEVQKHEDVCTLMNTKKEENILEFTTFIGMTYQIDLESFELLKKFLSK